MDTVRKNIRALMGERSINELAEAAGIGQTWLQRFMNPDKPSGIQKPNPDKLGPVARALGVSLNDLMFADLAGTPSAPAPSQAGGLDLGKLALAQKFLEDLFLGQGIRFVASEQTLLLAAVYQELMTASEPNLVEMAGRFGRQIRGKADERQRAAGGTVTDDRGGVGEGEDEAGVAHRRRRA